MTTAALAGATPGQFEELRRNWRILPPSLAGITLCSVHGYSLGVMIPAIERDYGWARAEIAAGLMIIAMIALFAAPLVGIAVDRFGPRRIALLGVPFFCLALGLLSTATANVHSWWLLWGVLALGNMCVLPTVWTAAINGYFDRNRGAALAIALCGTGLAGMFVPSLTQALIAGFGWRFAYIGLAALGLLITFPIVWLLFRVDPAAERRGAPSAAARSPNRGFALRQGFAQPSFIKLAAAIFVFSVALCALTTNSVPVLLARGLTPASAAALAGLIGLGSITGRLIGGLLLDRFDAAKVAAASVTLPIGAVVLLLAFPGSSVAAGAACLVIGLSVGTEVDCAAYLAARHFGLRSFGALFGAMNGLMLFGNGVAPVIANHVYDVTRSYEMVLWAQIPACLIAAALFLMLGPYPVFEEAAAPAGSAPIPAPVAA